MSETIKVDELKENLTFKSDLMIDERFILLPANVELPEFFIKSLKTWNFSELQYEGKKIETQTTTTVSPATDKIGDISIESFTTEKVTSDVAKNSQTNASQSVASQNVQTKPISTNALKPSQPVTKPVKIDNTDRNRLETVQNTYTDFLKQINSIYTRFATHRQLSFDELSKISKEICIFVRENKRYVLRVSPSAQARNKDFQVIHSMRSTVLAITIALEMKMDIGQIVELGVTCLVHEIGMLKLPPQLYLTDKMLSPAEKLQISKHPIFSYDILKTYNFPAMTQLGVLEHHEKENGQGYPRHINGTQISAYAKIISVACSFEAITAPRTYKTERTTFDAMVEMLKNPNNQYDGTVIKALLYSLSMYPIGAYVYLSNGKIATVIDVNPESPKNPIVQFVNDRDENGTLKTVQTDDEKNKILRVLSKKEQEDVLKNIEKENARLDKIQQDAEAEKKTQQQEKNEAEATPTTSTAPKETKSNYDSVDLSEFA